MCQSYADEPLNRESLKDWERTALELFAQKMNYRKHPFSCIPATIGFSKNQLRYGFIGNPRETVTTDKLASLMSQYTKESKDFGSYTSLIIYYQTIEEIKSNYKLEDYGQLFWKQLIGFHPLT